MAELGVGGVRENAKFRDGVHGGLHDEAAVHIIEVIGAVYQEIVGFWSLAVDGVSLAVAQ